MRPLPTKVSLALFTILAALSVYFALQLKFTFNFEQFFPEGDEDLEFYQQFISEFEADINFLLVAVENKEGVFKPSFLNAFHDFSIQTKKLPNITDSRSLTQFRYPLKTPFGITSIPAIHIDEPAKYQQDSLRIMDDPRLVNTLISKDGGALVVALKTTDITDYKASKALIDSLQSLVATYTFDDYHILGPAYFQKEIVEMQRREIIVSAMISAILVALIMLLIYRRSWGIAIALTSIGLGMLLFMGLLGAMGRELNAMAALYPVLMIIVGTSDVIHIMSKYIDELRKGQTRQEAIHIAIKEIGLATLLTSVTTAIGFASLMTSKIYPIRDFGLNAALGVLVAYGTVLFFTTSMLQRFEADQIIKSGRGVQFWDKLLRRCYLLTYKRSKWISLVSLGILLITVFGISKITTNYQIQNNLPRGKKISSDFRFFEKEFAGFRPFELAVFVKDSSRVNSYEVLQQINRVEEHLERHRNIRAIHSINTLYKSVNQMYHNNRPEAYQLAASKRAFLKQQGLINKIPQNTTAVLVSEDGKKARIMARISDLGADSIRQLSTNIDSWIAANIDTTRLHFRQTGTGMLMDKNADYVRRNLLQGLGLAILIISLLMALLFRNWRMMLISIVPNLIPLLMAGALLGFLGVELEAGIAIIFAVVFGIAVDDTIHFLSKYKLARDKGKDQEAALLITFTETGKAIVLTSVILFFGFLVMLFSIHPPSVTVGLLISLTLLSALLADFFLIPILIRKLL